MKDESDLKSRQIEACNENISHLNEEIMALSSSLQEKEAIAVQLQTYQQVASAQEQEQLELLKLTTKLEHKLQEVEYQKQQAKLEKDALIKELKASQILNAQFHAQLGK